LVLVVLVLEIKEITQCLAVTQQLEAEDLLVVLVVLAQVEIQQKELVTKVVIHQLKVTMVVMVLPMDQAVVVVQVLLVELELVQHLQESVAQAVLVLAIQFQEVLLLTQAVLVVLVA
jgi:hypothetical protein